MSGCDSSTARHSGSTPAAAVDLYQPFAVDVERRDDVAIVQPHGELDLVTVETLRAALAEIQATPRVVLDLRGLSFIDSTGLRLLVELHERAQRDGFQLTLVMPPAPADRAIQLSGLARTLPFGAAVGVEIASPARPGGSDPTPNGPSP